MEHVCLTRVSRCKHTSELVPRRARADRRPRWNSLIYRDFQSGAHSVTPSVLVRLADLPCPDALPLSPGNQASYCNLQDKECQSEAEWNEFAERYMKIDVRSRMATRGRPKPDRRYKMRARRHSSNTKCM